jgi:serine/threonine protein kinase
LVENHVSQLSGTRCTSNWFSAIAVEVSPEMEGATELAKTKTETKRKQELMRRYSFAADVWSLGCVFAEFLHGRILFQTNGCTDVSLLATIAARIGLPAEGVLAIKGWPDDRVLDLAKASRLVSKHMCTTPIG